MTAQNIRRFWRYQRGNQNPYIEEEQTTQWPKEKTQKDKQRSTQHTYKTKDRVTRTIYIDTHRKGVQPQILPFQRDITSCKLSVKTRMQGAQQFVSTFSTWQYNTWRYQRGNQNP
jgi:hypothetical protein